MELRYSWKLYQEFLTQRTNTRILVFLPRLQNSLRFYLRSFTARRTLKPIAISKKKKKKKKKKGKKGSRLLAGANFNYTGSVQSQLLNNSNQFGQTRCSRALAPQDFFVARGFASEWRALSRFRSLIPRRRPPSPLKSPRTELIKVLSLRVSTTFCWFVFFVRPAVLNTVSVSLINYRLVGAAEHFDISRDDRV